MNNKKAKKRKLNEIFGCQCFWCGQKLEKNEQTIDHLIPQSRGGSNSLENLRIACFSCNNSRGNSLFPPKPNRVNLVSESISL
ncbi:MAG: HNH endonuclease signature motif containing protein [Cyanobacteriota bacterium]|nr:HNH endonuclease signature motif containing protein [Cyanobacteriota bacterium]